MTHFKINAFDTTISFSQNDKSDATISTTMSNDIKPSQIALKGAIFSLETSILTLFKAGCDISPDFIKSVHASVIEKYLHEPEYNVLTESVYFVQSKNDYFFTIKTSDDLSAMKNAIFFEDEIALDNAIMDYHKEPLAPILIEAREGVYFEQSMNDCMYPTELKVGDNLSEYISNWVL